MPTMVCNDEHIEYPVTQEEADVGECLHCGSANVTIK